MSPYFICCTYKGLSRSRCPRMQKSIQSKKRSMSCLLALGQDKIDATNKTFIATIASEISSRHNFSCRAIKRNDLPRLESKTYRASTVAHPHITFDVKCRRTGEPEGLHVSEDLRLEETAVRP